MAANETSDTNPVESPGTRREEPKAIIAGSIIGGIAFLVLVIALIWLVLRRSGRQGRSDHLEGLRRDMMVSAPATVEMTASSRCPKGALTRAEGSRHSKVDSISSTTPLRETFEGEHDNTSSVSTSIYSCARTGTKSLAASDVSSTTVASYEAASEISIPPSILVSINPAPSPAYLGMPSRARTDRQMQIEQKIFELQGLFITANGSGEEKSRTMTELKERIEKVKDLRESEWAYGGNGEVPNILID
ncbi:hypothetical protein PM082_018474 [Marasmius tenuissimus]|nr:hypothetical protein PM082_018474 [Marasmius tenuissimus]